ncbi:MAG TPA: deoxyribodipyrimidine photo-lyase [Bacteroidia bacterium]|nr:deoxyribodipyrimidine photo-lyase [Bacteroidia bacterium]
MNIFWFRRDLRLEDNAGLYYALQKSNVQPIFIFDTNILSELPKDDARVYFIYQHLQKIDKELRKYNSSLKVYLDKPENVFRKILNEYSDLESVFTNEDYEPYAIKRDNQIKEIINEKGVSFHSFKDQVIFAKDEVLKNNKSPYTVFTHYKNKWLQLFTNQKLSFYPSEKLLNNLFHSNHKFPQLSEIGFKPSNIKVKDINYDAIKNYDQYRNFPYLNHTTYAGPHLRFGTVSIRKLVDIAHKTNSTYLSELIWREFFMQILYHFPYVVNSAFRKEYNNIQWENDEKLFELWKQGKTGFPMVDAGMRELNETGYMHNRVRMICASFLTKDLLIDWRWGEKYFAEKLLDYELSSNNGNWQWAAGTGCDAAPYFRIFNPDEQLKKFDPEGKYVRNWIPELSTLDYPKPVIDHKFARNRALDVYKKGLQK